MIGLALDERSATAAILPDGGDFVFGSEITMPDSSYREWLSAVPGLLDTLTGLDGAMPVAVALPAILKDDVVSHTPVQHLEGKNIRRDLQSAPMVPRATGRISNCRHRSHTSLMADNAGVVGTGALKPSCRAVASRKITNA